MKRATLCFPVKDGKILLGMKKKGFGRGNYNGFGGKIEEEEGIEKAASRELYEEAGISAMNIENAAELAFYFPHVHEEKGWDHMNLEEI